MKYHVKASTRAMEMFHTGWAGTRTPAFLWGAQQPKASMSNPASQGCCPASQAVCWVGWAGSGSWQELGEARNSSGETRAGRGLGNWKEQVRECTDGRGEGRTERRCSETETSCYSSGLWWKSAGVLASSLVTWKIGLHCSHHRLWEPGAECIN